MKVHRLKCLQPFYDQLKSGQKTFEVRYYLDRDFQIGDYIWLNEEPAKSSVDYDMNPVFKILGILYDYDCIGIEKDYCVLSLSPRVIGDEWHLVLELLNAQEPVKDKFGNTWVKVKTEPPNVDDLFATDDEIPF